MAQKLFVAMAGNIGTGKTTAAELLAHHFSLDLYHEPVLQNRFLTSYYQDMGRWSFTLQMEFLLKRIEHQAEIERLPRSGIQDRSLIEDPEVFAKYLHGLGHMTDEELGLYFDYFQRFHANARHPDRLILLHTPKVEVLLRRIDERGREAERHVTRTFIQGLNHYYETFANVARAKYGMSVLPIDVTNLDIRHGKGREEFLERVGAFLEDGEPGEPSLFGG